MKFQLSLLAAFLVLNASAQNASRQPHSIPMKGTVDLGQSADVANQAEAVLEMPRQGKSGPVKRPMTFPLAAEVNLDEIKEDLSPVLKLREMPKHSAQKIEHYGPPAKAKSASVSSFTLDKPVKGQSFFGNPFRVATPCDNDIAVSDSMLVSVMNTNIYVRNYKSGVASLPKSLQVFTTPINNNHSEFDPKVIYDPDKDRFILMCLVGTVHSNSKVVMGFSKTNNPNGAWNLYVLPGDPNNDTLWTDYPMLALTEREVFLTVNLLKDNSSWQAGFVETLIWQIRKDSGYAGKPLASVLHSNIKHNGRPLRNLCPVKGGSRLYAPNMYFLSNRNFASQNDTVFLVNVTDTIGAPNASLTIKPLTSNQPYYFAGDARQPVATESLATNDSRNLGAFYENNTIQYVHNTMNPANNRVTVYYGVIENVNSSSPAVTGYLIPNDSADYGYPNLSYAGTSAGDNSAIISFDHSSNLLNPGVSALLADGKGNFSPVLNVQNGATHTNLLQGGLERWGDYSGSQRVYSRPGEVWISGYYSYKFDNTYPYAHGAWIAQLITDSVAHVGIHERQTGANQASLYPNPAGESFSLRFTLPSPEYLRFHLLDASGKLYRVLLEDFVRVTDNEFSFLTRDLPPGIYFLKVSGDRGTSINRKVVVR